MTTELNTFLANLITEDFKGTQTKKLFQKKAKSFLNSDAYQYNESILINAEKFDIYVMLI